MSTERERMQRNALIAGLVVVIIATGLLIGGYLTSAQWMTTSQVIRPAPAVMP